jgi:pyruvate/2-oxoglutarate/acetoin dehydrogenase E1 component
MEYKEQIAKSTVELMVRNLNAVVMGVGVTDQKGIFGTTKLANDMYPERVWETPLSEHMLTGAAWGMALNGYIPILVHARADFLMLTMEHLVNTAAKWHIEHQRKGKPPTMIVRAIIGKGWGQGPQHSQAFIGTLAQIYGITVHAPVFLEDIDIAFKAAEMIGGLHIIIEHRSLYSTSFNRVSNPDNPTVEIHAISGAYVEALQAADILKEQYGEVPVVTTFADNLDLDSEYQRFFQRDCKNCVIVDVENNGIGIKLYHLMKSFDDKVNVQIVSPPEYPLPTSWSLELEWYPSPQKIVDTALALLGKNMNQKSYTDTKVAFPKDGPF